MQGAFGRHQNSRNKSWDAPPPLPETNSSQLRIDGWNTIRCWWDRLFSGAFAISFREAMFKMIRWKLYRVCWHVPFLVAFVKYLRGSKFKFFSHLAQAPLYVCHPLGSFPFVHPNAVPVISTITPQKNANWKKVVWILFTPCCFLLSQCVPQIFGTVDGSEIPFPTTLGCIPNPCK